MRAAAAAVVVAAVLVEVEVELEVAVGEEEEGVLVGLVELAPVPIARPSTTAT